MSFCHIFFNLKSSTFLPRPHSPVMTLRFPSLRKTKASGASTPTYTQLYESINDYAPSTESQFDVLHALLRASSRVSPQLVSPLCPFHQLFPLYCIILIGIQTFCYFSYYLLKVLQENVKSPFDSHFPSTILPQFVASLCNKVPGGSYSYSLSAVSLLSSPQIHSNPALSPVLTDISFFRSPVTSMLNPKVTS